MDGDEQQDIRDLCGPVSDSQAAKVNKVTRRKAK